MLFICVGQLSGKLRIIDQLLIFLKARSVQSQTARQRNEVNTKLKIGVCQSTVVCFMTLRDYVWLRFFAMSLCVIFFHSDFCVVLRFHSFHLVILCLMSLFAPQGTQSFNVLTNDKNVRHHSGLPWLQR